jgi:uncharacterized protein YjiS (DUF1127 family)
MSAMFSTLFQPAVTVRSGRYVRQLFYAWARDIARSYDRRTALKRLSELSDRELQDIGLTRGELEAAVYGSVTRPDQGRMR